MVGKLLYSCGADWVYATKQDISDPHLAYVTPETTHVLVSGLDYGTYSQFKHLTVHTYDQLKRQLAPGERPTIANLAAIMVNLAPQDEIVVGSDFPAFLYKQLIEKDINLKPLAGTVFAERGVKLAAECGSLRQAQACSAAGFAAARDILAQATINSQTVLEWRGETLTSEILRHEIRLECLKNGAIAFDCPFGGAPIVSCGAQAATPHERGHGPLLAGQTIIIDNFPQHSSFYWGDLTRTYVKGTPTGWQERLYDAVLQAQTAALDVIKADVCGSFVHKQCVDTFERLEWMTGALPDGTDFGFFHSTGHAVGLELHDPVEPRLSVQESKLKPGHVVTVEPGLYYPEGTCKEIGGCRIEDMVIVTDTGCENITDCSKDDWVVA